MSTDYESLTYSLKFRRACKTALIILLICAVVIAPALWLWGQSIEMRQALREAKNVVNNMNLLGLESYGFDKPVIDKGRPSGMTREGEKEVRSFSGAEGEIHLISWNTKKNCVATMSYQKGRFLVKYQYEESENTGVWEVYRKIHQYDNEG